MARVNLGSRLRAAAIAAVWTLAALGGARPAAAQTADLPTLTQPVNDFAHVIDPSSAAAMDQMIRSLQTTTGDAVVVATVKTFAPFGSIEEYAVKLYERAGIGAKGKDNGLLILVAVEDRRARIEVGYGLEGFITDGFSGDVIRGALLPAFRRGAYGEGLLDATTRVISRIAKERNVTLSNLPEPAPERTPELNPQVLAGIVKLIVIIIVVLFILARRGGGGAGGGNGLLWFLLGQALSNGGRRSRGGWSGWNGGFGGGGFGGGGGGFGGFGGGSSGGGGASGSW